MPRCNGMGSKEPMPFGTSSFRSLHQSVPFMTTATKQIEYVPECVVSWPTEWPGIPSERELDLGNVQLISRTGDIRCGSQLFADGDPIDGSFFGVKVNREKG